MNMKVEEFDQREQIIKNEMNNIFKNRMTPRDFHTIDMFCTIYKDKFCDD